MKKHFAFLLIAIAAPAWSAGMSSSEPAAAQSQEAVIDQFRNDLQAKQADIMAKGLTLTAEQAAKFWPLFEQYQKEQSEIVAEQIKATQEYAKHFQDLSDADAQKYVSALLVRDEKIHALRVKWLAKFKTAVPTKIAARAIQIDRRLGQVTQVRISSQIPLIR